MSVSQNNHWLRSARRKTRLFSMLGLLGGLVAGGTPAANAEPGGEVKTIGDWSLVCPKDHSGGVDRLPPCEIVQTVRARRDSQSAVRLAFAHSGARDAFGMHLTLPGDTRASGGVVIRLNDSIDLQYPVSVCESGRCTSEKLIGAKEMAYLRRAHNGFVATVDANANLKRIPLSFSGFNEALDEMARRNRQWARMQLQANIK